MFWYLRCNENILRFILTRLCKISFSKTHKTINHRFKWSIIILINNQIHLFLNYYRQSYGEWIIVLVLVSLCFFYVKFIRVLKTKKIPKCMNKCIIDLREMGLNFRDIQDTVKIYFLTVRYIINYFKIIGNWNNKSRLGWPRMLINETRNIIPRNALTYLLLVISYAATFFFRFYNLIYNFQFKYSH